MPTDLNTSTISPLAPIDPKVPTRRRQAIVAAGAAVVLGSLPVLPLSAAPLAHADHTVSVYDLCSNYRPGYVPAIAGFTLGGVRCTSPTSIGLSALIPPDDSSTGGLIAPGFPGLPPGAYRVNPVDPFSDWVVPD
jgi:hypothetical protein